MTQKSIYAVKVQPIVTGTIGIVTGPAFTVEVEANDLAQAERRAIRRAVANAVSYNERNQYAVGNGDIPERSESSNDYRAIAARLTSTDEAPIRAASTPVEPAAPKKVLVTVDITALLLTALSES
ncbi:hypothetical protein [Nocardia salmonicida]|uniref:hypothetical protein n=1 Tax=Nocardia salmonicida TaxID=53431 RepID=UPI0007A3E198|nr:hypothetical protein [Nocardia salmonicida]MBC7299819.1 hypothetical protein [Nocardia sp.]